MNRGRTGNPRWRVFPPAPENFEFLAENWEIFVNHYGNTPRGEFGTTPRGEFGKILVESLEISREM